MLLTRRTVQTHISRALHKLGLRSRNQIAREVLRNAGSHARMTLATPGRFCGSADDVRLSSPGRLSA